MATKEIVMTRAAASPAGVYAPGDRRTLDDKAADELMKAGAAVDAKAFDAERKAAREKAKARQQSEG